MLLPMATKRQERSSVTREALLGAATAELIESDGLLEVGRVAARAGVSTGALYHQFGSKAGLLGALVEDFYERLGEAVLRPDLAELGDWGSREHARIERTVSFHYEDPVAVVLAGLAREPEVAAAEAPFVAATIGAAERNIRAAQRAGEIDASIDAGIAAAMIMGGIRAVLESVLVRERRPRAERLVEELWRLVGSAVGWQGAGNRQQAKPRRGR
jgi:AcrR family transcriptional regulator